MEYPDPQDLWCFIGNAFSGFKLYNKQAGIGKILSSNVDTSSNTGGNTYPVMTSEPVPSTHNTYWIPVASSYTIDGRKGFFYISKASVQLYEQPRWPFGLLDRWC